MKYIIIAQEIGRNTESKEIFGQTYSKYFIERQGLQIKHFLSKSKEY